MRVSNLEITATRLRLFAIIAISAVIATVLASPIRTVQADGVNWTIRNSPANNNWRSVTWGGPAGQETFVAVSSTGT